MKFLIRLFILLLILVLSLVGFAYWWVFERPVPMQSTLIDYAIEPGSSPRSIANLMHSSGIEIMPDVFVLAARASGRDKLLKAGAYEVKQGDTMWQMLERMANGDMTQVRLTIPEGWTFKQIMAALDASDMVKHDTDGLSEAEIITKLGLQTDSLEGMLYPDTYVFTPGSSDLDILRRSIKIGQQVLDDAWAERDPDLPLKSPYEALILASIIEKETGNGNDRARIAGVFANRLRIDMPLQTDPTVIYGMGDKYQGRIRKKDLSNDTLWNTYTRKGLPPTPIASPGKAAIMAAVNPEKHKYYYFVSRGDGTSEFSENLNLHNRAVRKYILKRN